VLAGEQFFPSKASAILSPRYKATPEGIKTMKKATNSAARHDRVVTRAEVLTMFGNISLPTLYRLIKAGKFPSQVKIAQNRVGFLQSEIDAHMERLKNERDVQRDAQRETEAA
jgi:predicted DNA-binding transcriptional regulator AlpA